MNQSWIDPVFFSLGPVQVHWYGFMYVLSFVVGGILLRWLARKNFWTAHPDTIDMFTCWIIVGVFLGARLTYVFVYNWEHFSVHPGEIFSVWKGGLSFHGAAIGMTLASWIFARTQKVHFLQITDCLTVVSAQGLFWGRIGNFINGELYGRVTDSWVGVSFPGGGPFPRHPPQLYEAFLEGVVITVLLTVIMKRERFYGVATAAFFALYGSFRFIVEFFREPDPQLGYYVEYFTMGQVLSLMMIPFGVLILLFARKFAIRNPLLPERKATSSSVSA